jgi:hypothetical protein
MNPFSRNQSCYLLRRTKYRLGLPGDPGRTSRASRPFPALPAAPPPHLRRRPGHRCAASARTAEAQEAALGALAAEEDALRGKRTLRWNALGLGASIRTLPKGTRSSLSWSAVGNLWLGCECVCVGRRRVGRAMAHKGAGCRWMRSAHLRRFCFRCAAVEWGGQEGERVTQPLCTLLASSVKRRSHTFSHKAERNQVRCECQSCSPALDPGRTSITVMEKKKNPDS